MRDPDRKQLHEEAKRWRRRCRDLEGQIADGELTRADVCELTVKKEFYRLATQRVDETGAAFKLADRSHLTTDDDGTIAGVQTMIDKVNQNYPFLSATLKTSQPPARPGS